MTNPINLSAVILTLNEADRIKPCLESLQELADEILVLDCGSQDDTVNICNQYPNVNVVETDWPGEGIQRQRMIDLSRGEWLLWIDADERVSPELKQEIQQKLSNTTSNVNAYDIKWSTIYFKQACIFGGLGDSHIRLFKRSDAQFDKDHLVHPKVHLNNKKVETLKGRLLHESFRNYQHLLAKNIDYSLRGAQQKVNKNKSASIPEALLRSLWRFIKVYLIDLGILDGQRGFLNAVMAAQYVFNKYAAIWASKHTNQL